MKTARLHGSIIYHGLAYEAGSYWRTSCGKRMHRDRLCWEPTTIEMVNCESCLGTYTVRKALDWPNPVGTVAEDRAHHGVSVVVPGRKPSGLERFLELLLRGDQHSLTIKHGIESEMRARVLALLRKVREHLCPDTYWHVCIGCGVEEPKPCKPDCELAKLVREIEGERT